MEGHPHIHLLVVDDDLEFRRKALALSKLRFQCTMVSTEVEVREAMGKNSIDLILIDLGLGSDSGLRILSNLRDAGVTTPVIVLAGREDRVAQQTLDDCKVKAVIDKPVNLDELTAAILSTLCEDPAIPFLEPTISELMISPDLYQKLYLDESVTKAIKVLKHAFFETRGEVVRTRLRSALVFDRAESFQGIVHLDDILRLVHSERFVHSPYMSSYTGMFLNQARGLRKMTISRLLRDQPAITPDTPIMEAVHLMLENGLINIPVIEKGKLIGILRDKDIILEIARILHVD